MLAILCMAPCGMASQPMSPTPDDQHLKNQEVKTDLTDVTFKSNTGSNSMLLFSLQAAESSVDARDKMGVPQLREKFLNTAIDVAKKAAAFPTQPERVASRLLSREINLAPSFGRAELSFLGSGRVGGGGTLDGTWNYLIGPAYSSPDFLAKEQLCLLFPDGKPVELRFNMRRMIGSGILFGRTEVNKLVVELYEFAPWDGVDVIRLVHLHNSGTETISDLRLGATVQPRGTAAIEEGVLAIRSATNAHCFGGSEPNWAPRVARVAWSGNGGDAQPGYLVRSGVLSLPAGAGETRALVHRVEWAADAKPLPPLAQGKPDLEKAIVEWKTWLNAGDKSILTNPRLGMLLESQLVFIRMEQSYDGGLIAGVRRYSYSYPRDMHGAARGFLATGHLREVELELRWMDRKYRRFKTIVNSSEMGTDIVDFYAGHKGSELPAYYLLMARGYLAAGGRGEVIDEMRDSLQHAADIQISTSRKDGWRFKYNGDETERYVPTKDGAPYDFSTPEWKNTSWCMPSQVLAMASVDFFVRELVPRWKLDAAPYREAVEEWKKSFAPTFLPEGRTVPVWTIFNDGTIPAQPVPNYLCFPAWVQAPFPEAQRAAWTWQAASYLREDGWLAVMPGRVEGTCGHSLAILLSAMIKSGADRAVTEHLVNLILAGGMLQHYGLVNEFYGPKGTPNPHNLRPFETGPLLEALVQSTKVKR